MKEKIIYKYKEDGERYTILSYDGEYVVMKALKKNKKVGMPYKEFYQHFSQASTKEFSSNEEMLQYGESFGKHQFERVLCEGKTKILCGTDMAYEEDIWDGVDELLNSLINKFVGPDAPREYLIDKITELRDDVIGYLEKTYDFEFVDVYEEY